MIRLNNLNEKLVDATESELKNLSGGAIGFVGGVAVATAGVIYDNLTGATPNATIISLGRGILSTGISTALGGAFAGPKGASLSD